MATTVLVSASITPFLGHTAQEEGDRACHNMLPLRIPAHDHPRSRISAGYPAVAIIAPYCKLPHLSPSTRCLLLVALGRHCALRAARSGTPFISQGQQQPPVPAERALRAVHARSTASTGPPAELLPYQGGALPHPGDATDTGSEQHQPPATRA
jgi:hypothetical protein